MTRRALRRTLEAVVKVTERCNINCTYCYVFNKGDESYKLHDPYMKPETVDALGRFLSDGARDLGYDEILLDLHGGEPLMMKPARFIAMCETIQRLVPEGCRVGFTVQTNAMLVTEEWLDILQRFNFAVGVSLDGPAAINDKDRVDHRGRGTYVRTRSGLEKLVQARTEGRIRSLGILTVANASYDIRDIFRHFVDELHVDHMDFLLPIESHDTFDTSEARAYGQLLIDLYDAWIARGDGAVFIRTLSNTIRFFQHGAAISEIGRQSRDGDHVVFTVSSSGHLGPDDSLRTVTADAFAAQRVQDTTLAEFLTSTQQKGLLRAENTLPDACWECAWSNGCRGGASNGRLVNRYSTSRGFNNPSIFCAGLQDFFSHVAADLLRRGMSFERLSGSLVHNAGDLQRYSEPCDFASVAPEEMAV